MKTAIILLACILLAGCTTTVTRQELDVAVAAHAHETINWVKYAGSKDEYHYVVHGYTLGSKTYRIAQSDLKIDNQFPLTKDESKWRPLTGHWGIWMSPKPGIDSQPTTAPYSAPAARTPQR